MNDYLTKYNKAKGWKLVLDGNRRGTALAVRLLYRAVFFCFVLDG
jgi:hypothetical protein